MWKTIHLKTRQQTEAFQKKHDFDTTPQTFIGGYDDLQEWEISWLEASATVGKVAAATADW